MNDARAEMATGVVVVAAGMGTRLGAGRPKALVPVEGEAMVLRALRPIRSLSPVQQIVVVVPATHRQEFADLLPPDVVVVDGGAERTDSVRAGLAALDRRVGIVVVHDAARCDAPTAVFEAVVQAVRAGADAVVPGLAVVDTIKQVDEAGVVLSTPPRERLRAVQTPQAFARDVLERAHAAGGDATDDAALVEQSGGRVLVINGDPRAAKITTAHDLARREASAF